MERFLREETTLATNKIYLGLEKFRFYPNYYVAVNRKVICQSADEIKRLNCAKFILTQRRRSGPVSAKLLHRDGTP